MGLRILPVNFFDQVTDLSVSPAAVTTMPATNLQSNVRDDVWRSTSLNAQVFTWSFGGNVRRVSSWGVFPAKGGAASLLGTQVRVELFSDAARTVSVYDSGTLDAFTFTGTGYGDFAYGAQQYGVDNQDRTARLAPILKFITGIAVGSGRITLSNGGAVDTSYLEASRIWIADYVEAPYNAKFGAAPRWAPGSKQIRTIGSTLRRLRRSSWRELHFDTHFTSEADRSAWSDLMYVADPASEIVLSLFPANPNAKLERDFTVLGSLEVLNPQVFQDHNFHTLQLAMVES